MSSLVTETRTVVAERATGIPLSRLRGFHPGWFGAVLGTAVIGIVAYQDPGSLAGLRDAGHAVGVAMVGLAALLALALGVPYVARWLRHPAAAVADLRNPLAGALYGTFPGGILVLAVGIATVGPSLGAADLITGSVAALAVVGVALAFAVSVVFAYLLFATPEIGPQTANGAWFIPPVVNIVVPLALVPLLPHVSRGDALSLLAGGYAFFGMGLLLFLLVASLLYDRLVFHPLPAAPLAPSLWIGLGPYGRRAARAAPARAGRRACVGDICGNRRDHLDDCGDRTLGLRIVVAWRGDPGPRGLSAPGPAAVRHRLVGVHVPARRVHGEHARPGPRMGLGAA